jgi:hypothetical protein
MARPERTALGVVTARSLRQHHPDVGGLTADMQNLSEALVWLEQNETSLWCGGYFDTVDNDIPF